MLSFLLGLPVLGATVVSVLPKGSDDKRLRQAAVAFAIASLAWSLWLLFQFNLTRSGVQFTEFLPWLEPIRSNYSIGLDGLSFPLAILNGFLAWMMLLSSSGQIERPRLYYALLLLVNAGITGALVAQNLFLIFVCIDHYPGIYPDEVCCLFTTFFSKLLSMGREFFSRSVSVLSEV